MEVGMNMDAGGLVCLELSVGGRRHRTLAHITYIWARINQQQLEKEKDIITFNGLLFELLWRAGQRWKTSGD